MPRLHIPLELRKIFCGRERVLTAMEPRRPTAECGGPFDQTHNLALGHVTDEPSPDPSEPGGLTLAEFLDERRRRIDGLNTPAVHSNHPEVIDALRAAVTSLQLPTCSVCEQRHGRVCNGGTDDDALIDHAQPGPCLQSLIEAFRLARAEAQAYYREFCRSPETLVFPPVALHTAINQTPHSFGRARGVGGVTLFEAAGSPRASIVKLYLDARRLDLESLYAVPYVLLHECVCHAYSGIRPGSEPRQHTGEADRFAEGWMDWATMLICIELQRDESLAGNRALNNDEFKIGVVLHDARGTANDSASPARKLGAKAAARFLGALRTHFGRDAAWEYFLRISFDWNADPTQYLERQRFVAHVLDCLDNRESLPDLLRRVASYIGGAPLEVLLPR